MKLRNKKTDEIVYVYMMYPDTAQVLENTLTLKELNENWEDYATPEPLIKDEKIREIILLCANKYETDAYRIASDSAKVHILGYVDTQYSAFSLELYNTPIVDCDSEKLYTITELCGKEE